MKKTLLTVMVAAAMTSTLAQAVTTIDQGTLTINGQINDAPATSCTMTITGGTDNNSVSLEAVTVDKFSAVDSVSTANPFSLQFTGCPVMTTAQLQLNGTADLINGTAFSNTGTATGVAVQIQATKDSSAMLPNQLNTLAYQATNDAFSVPLSASIIRTSPVGTNVTTGTVIATPTIQITYD